MDQSAPDVALEPNDPAAEAMRFLHDLMLRRPIVSWAIAVACAACFGLQLLWGRGNLLLPAVAMGAEVPSRVLAGEWWRLLSVMLLHGSFEHLALNLLALLSFGPFLERMLGSARYLVLYVLSGLGGSLLSLQRGGDGIGVGASGGIWGLMVAGAVLVTWPRGLLPAVLAAHWRKRAWTPVVINLAYSFMPGIDIRAHLGGGIAGGLLLLALLRGQGARIPMPARRAASMVATGTAVLLLVAIGLAFATGQPWALSAPWQLVPATFADGRYALQVPQGMHGRDIGEDRWKWGDLDADGAEIVVYLAPALSEGETEEQTLTAMLGAVREQQDKGYRRVQEPTRTRLPSGREAVWLTQVPTAEGDARQLSMWWLIEDRRLVLVAGNVVESMVPLRAASLPLVVDSLHRQAAPK